MKVYSGQVSSNMVLLSVVYILGSLAAIALVLGLCLIDSGLVRRKNVLDTWVQKLVAALLAALGEAVAGYALWQYTFDKAFGVPQAFTQALKDWWLGGNLLKVPAANIDPTALPQADAQQVFFVFFLTFAMAAAALLHSSVIERIRPVALYTMSFVFGAVLLPVMAFLTWGPLSPLTTHGLHDFEGVLTIYVFIGTFALVLAQRLKPRLGTYDLHSSGSRPVPHNLSMVNAGSILIVIAIPLILLGSGFIAPGQGYTGSTSARAGSACCSPATPCPWWAAASWARHSPTGAARCSGCSTARSPASSSAGPSLTWPSPGGACCSAPAARWSRLAPTW